jgi:hypothetical protein
MAADSQCTRGTTPSPTTKLFRGPDGSVLGIAGDFNQALALIDFVCGRSESPPDFSGADVTVLQLRRDGIWTYDNSARPIRVDLPFFAVGSGGDIALGAMHMGAAPEQAVKAAIRFDVFSGGRIQTMTLESDASKRRKKNDA